jgi:hypothetical protein
MIRRAVSMCLVAGTILFASPPANALRADYTYAVGVSNQCALNSCFSYFEISPWSSTDARGTPALTSVSVHNTTSQVCEAPYWLYDEASLSAGFAAGYVLVGAPWTNSVTVSICNVYQWRISFLAANGQ